MPRYFTHLWDKKTLKYNQSNQNEPVSHLFSKPNGIVSRVQPGDYVYVVGRTTNESPNEGEFLLIGRLFVSKICDTFEAADIFGMDPEIYLNEIALILGINIGELEGLKTHVFGNPEKCSLHSAERIVPYSVWSQLQFNSHDKPRLTPQKNNPEKLDQQTLRQVRELTFESANLLDPFLTFSVSSQEIANSNKKPKQKIKIIKRKLSEFINVGESPKQMLQRQGQEKFRRNVLQNYNYECCFPECPIKEESFLVAGHVARWKDHLKFAGQIENGLAFCLMHDRAFELGFFTIGKNRQIIINNTNRISDWSEQHLMPYQGMLIKQGEILVSVKYLLLHWERIGFTPEV